MYGIGHCAALRLCRGLHMVCLSGGWVTGTQKQAWGSADEKSRVFDAVLD